jgi:hypothetical protein
MHRLEIYNTTLFNEKRKYASHHTKVESIKAVP